VCRQRRNLDVFRSVGVEAELELHPAPAWTLWATYLFNPTEIVSAPTNPELEGNRGSRTAQHAFSGSVHWSDPAILDALLSARWVGRRFEDDLNSLELEPFFVLDSRVARALSTHLEVFAGVENVFDTEYETSRATSGLVRVGGPRMIRGGMRVSL
jgi:outer membrane receptor protein involved in Fe transport